MTYTDEELRQIRDGNDAAEWLRNPFTKRFIKWLEEQRLYVLEQKYKYRERRYYMAMGEIERIKKTLYWAQNFINEQQNIVGAEDAENH